MKVGDKIQVLPEGKENRPENWRDGRVSGRTLNDVKVYYIDKKPLGGTTERCEWFSVNDGWRVRC